MEFHIPKRLHRQFWTLFPFVMVFVTYQMVVQEWEFHSTSFNELEANGEVFFAFVESAVVSALLVHIFILVKSFWVKWMKVKE